MVHCSFSVILQLLLFACRNSVQGKGTYFSLSYSQSELNTSYAS